MKHSNIENWEYRKKDWGNKEERENREYCGSKEVRVNKKE